jgi:hypothetical protein
VSNILTNLPTCEVICSVHCCNLKYSEFVRNMEVTLEVCLRLIFLQYLLLWTLIYPLRWNQVSPVKGVSFGSRTWSKTSYKNAFLMRECRWSVHNSSYHNRNNSEDNDDDNDNNSNNKHTKLLENDSDQNLRCRMHNSYFA